MVMGARRMAMKFGLDRLGVMRLIRLREVDPVELVEFLGQLIEDVGLVTPQVGRRDPDILADIDSIHDQHRIRCDVTDQRGELRDPVLQRRTDH
ncbi:hypothetical protein QP028_14990 [Corynebacterium suedekumii]|nr:hypothetical protein QP028_14990 [Corynebacterium suedekumii]